MTPEIIAYWPGKSFETGTHPALWHMLDVGAVASRLVAAQGFSGDPARDRAMVFLVTLHDLGKISAAFRDMLLGLPSRGPRHFQHSYRLLHEHDARIAAVLGGTKPARERLYGAIAGHHGGPPANLEGNAWDDQMRLIGDEALRIAGQVIDAVAGLFPGASLDGLEERKTYGISWALSGLTVQADWIGSNTEWFPRQSPDIAVADYWRNALGNADRAIREAGLLSAQPIDGGAARVLDGRAPRPMQEAAGAIALPEGPMLALIEDATGAGKTEAALVLAARMMAAGKARGFYFALPTMATSNAMLGRLAKIAPRLFAGRPTLALTHGKAGMNDLFREIRAGGGETRSDGVTCTDWLADDRRRVLLADMGVGTIDQALLAALPTRFSTLRLHALSGRVLIVDEAHSYDPYMEEELLRLLEFQAMLGGSAIVITATLPRAMRDGFAQAFRKGLGFAAPQRLWPGAPEPEPLIAENAYPLLSVVAKNVACRKPAPVPATCREIAVNRLADAAAALDLVGTGAAGGAACVWVRNAVDDAITAYQTLRQRGIAADLLHARFTVADRLEKEQALQARFGRDGRGREGRVLVATQVVEASLDLDFDLMVSDLAPISVH